MSRLVLIGCGKEKAAASCEARDLYTGNLFAARRRYAEATGERWEILSAKHGLIEPDVFVEPYDLTIGDLNEPDRAAWALTVVQHLVDELPDEAKLGEVVLELHAGADYAGPLGGVARAVGFSVAWPVEGLSIGQQLAHYKAKRAAVPS